MTEIRSARSPAVGSLAPPAALPPPPRRRSSGLRLLAALGAVAMLGYAGYLFGVQSDVYATEASFAVRQADMPRLAGGSGLLGAPGMLATLTESNAVVQYLRSRDALNELETRLPLRRFFERDGIDPLSRLSANATPEDLLLYLRQRVRPYFDHTSGIVTVEVQAFSPTETRDLAVAVEDLAEALVNRMSISARRGLMAAAEAEVEASSRHLAELRDRLRSFREQTERLDPTRSAVAADTLRARLENEISIQRAQLDQQRAYLAETSPAMRQGQERLEALQRELREQLRQNTGERDGALTAALHDYEALEAEMASAQKSYEAVLETLERTRGDANRQQIYLAHVVRPWLPSSPSFPRRWQELGTALAIGLLGGLLLLLLARTVREHIR